MRGIRTAEQIVPKGDGIYVTGANGRFRVDATVVAAGIAVQSQWYLWGKDTRNIITEARESSGLGYAQVSDWQMKTPILDGYGKYTGGYGLPYIDQTTPKGAVQAMAARIGLVLEALAERCPQCTGEDQLIAAALAQNGSGFYAESMMNAPMEDGRIAWDKVFRDFTSHPKGLAGVRQDITGYQFDTTFMLKLYLNDLRELHHRGWELPLVSRRWIWMLSSTSMYNQRKNR
ncbi:hypothetical protein D6779_05660 [Candidatus Parcubacteria bacterium]|nr:MAG: hypothetical protein D6779_05660 [Candidatus Parcubacteria bacterium]